MDRWQRFLTTCFFAAAGFAVISASARLCASGPVPGLLADSYRAEVYAILCAAQLARAASRCILTPKPLSGPGKASAIAALLPPMWAADVWQLLGRFACTSSGFALSLHWIRGHVLLDQPLTPVELLHARCNHAADLAAKRAARASLALSAPRLSWRHLWLQRLFLALAATDLWHAWTHSAVWEIRLEGFKPGLEAALLLWKRNPRILPFQQGAAATARDLLVHCKAVRRCISKHGFSAALGASAWTLHRCHLASWGEEQAWVERGGSCFARPDLVVCPRIGPSPWGPLRRLRPLGYACRLFAAALPALWCVCPAAPRLALGSAGLFAAAVHLWAQHNAFFTAITNSACKGIVSAWSGGRSLSGSAKGLLLGPSSAKPPANKLKHKVICLPKEILKREECLMGWLCLKGMARVCIPPTQYTKPDLIPAMNHTHATFKP